MYVNVNEQQKKVVENSVGRCNVAGGNDDKQEVQDPVTEESVQVQQIQFPFHKLVM